jgi:isopentenyl-diphosphate delta-isomerase type 1
MSASADELLDVVDADNRVIGRASRSAVHREGSLHRAVHVLVFDSGGRLYIQRRALDKDCDPGLWDTSAAGHLASGEEPAAGAKRELAEELAVSGLALKRLFELPACAATGNEFVTVYRAHSAVEPQPDATEIAEGRWCEADELRAWIARAAHEFTPSFRLLYARYLRQFVR